MARQHVEALSGRAEGAGTQRDLGGEKGVMKGGLYCGVPGSPSFCVPPSHTSPEPASELGQAETWGCVRSERVSRG